MVEILSYWHTIYTLVRTCEHKCSSYMGKFNKKDLNATLKLYSLHCAKDIKIVSIPYRNQSQEPMSPEAKLKMAGNEFIIEVI